MTLKEIVKEVERIGEMYRNNESKEARKSYVQYVELIILNEAEKPQQYDLCDYWERLIN